MQDDYQEVANLLAEYEAQFKRDPNAALAKMIDLYPRANEALNHDVASAINIWIYQHINKTIGEYLKEKVEINNDLNRAYLNWLSRLD